jgi:hypothetical protein
VVQRLAALAVPQHDGLALVGDADPRQCVDAGPRVRGGDFRDAAGHVPDLGGVVLHPAGAGEVLRELAVRTPAHLPVAVDHQAGAARGALVDG